MGIKNQRKGYIVDKERTFLFTHYDPVTHMAWSDDIKDKTYKEITVWGYWIPYDMIKWI